MGCMSIVLQGCIRFVRRRMTDGKGIYNPNDLGVSGVGGGGALDLTWITETKHTSSIRCCC